MKRSVSSGAYSSQFEEAAREQLLQERILSFVAHDLRAPLQSILGFCEMLLEGSLSKPAMSGEQQECIRIIQQSGEDQLHLINSLLDALRSTADQITLAPQSLDLPQHLPGLLAPFRPQMEERHLTLQASFPADLPALWTDRDQFRRILENLLNNAIKFTPPGGRIILSAAAEDKRFVRISISDTGIGIDPGKLDLVFAPFLRLHQDIPGFGLGLPIAKNLVEQQGGQIGVESVPGRGSTFFFTLPVASV